MPSKFNFPCVKPPHDLSEQDWASWQWQFKNRLSNLRDFKKYFNLMPSEEQAIEEAPHLFQIKVTPYYATLADSENEKDSIRKILMPTHQEMSVQYQQQFDPLGERNNNPVPRIIHRYPDRLLFLVTDHCSVYCRYCTRKHFTGQSQAAPKKNEYEQALEYIRAHPQVREVILSGGDPLTLGDSLLDKILSDIRDIDHVEIIRIGTRVPVVMPMRVTEKLVQVIKKYSPVYIMNHFNHPDEITQQSAQALSLLVDAGLPNLNQMVLLNGVNNHPAIVQALSRRLLYLRVKPYYMFQCDPSEGTDHLRTSVEDSLEIQSQLWGRFSGLGLPQLSLDIPNGGGKVGLVPDYQVAHQGNRRVYKGWDGITAEYISPVSVSQPNISKYQKEWEALCDSQVEEKIEKPKLFQDERI